MSQENDPEEPGGGIPEGELDPAEQELLAARDALARARRAARDKGLRPGAPLARRRRAGGSVLPGFSLSLGYTLLYLGLIVLLPLAALVVLGGVLTAVPLLLFAIAARRMPLSTLGFIQYLAPSIVFILGLTVFEQPLAPAKLLSFLFIWAAVGIFVADTLRRSRIPRPA